MSCRDFNILSTTHPRHTDVNFHSFAESFFKLLHNLWQQTARCLKREKKRKKKICLSASNCAEKTADASITSALLQSWGEGRRSLSAFCTPVGIKETALLIPPFYLPFTVRTFSNPAMATSLFPRLLFYPPAVPPALGALQELLGAIPAAPRGPAAPR